MDELDRDAAPSDETAVRRHLPTGTKPGRFAKHDREPDEAWRAEEDLARQLGLKT